MSKKGRGRWLVVHCHKTSAIKLTMADTQEWRHLFMYFIVGILILYSKNVLCRSVITEW